MCTGGLFVYMSAHKKRASDPMGPQLEMAVSQVGVRTEPWTSDLDQCY